MVPDMSDLLLTHGYFLFEDEKEAQIMRPYPTLGLLYISAYLRRDGIDVEIFDSTFQSRQELLHRLARDRGVIGIYTNLMTRKPVLDIVAAAKGYGWTVILGGPESANYPVEYLMSGADVIVVGEGELTMAELLPALAARGVHRLHGVPGTVFRDEEGVVITNPERMKIADLDTIPWPDRGKIDQARYVDVWRAAHGMGSVNMITARGCPYKCNWCSHAVFGYTHRRRGYLDCANELEHIMEVYRPDQVWYADDVFTIHHGWLFDYARELKRRNLRVPFETISRADRMMKDEVLQTLADLGCYRIWIGSESGSQRILDGMERGVKTEQVIWDQSGEALRNSSWNVPHVGLSGRGDRGHRRNGRLGQRVSTGHLSDHRRVSDQEYRVLLQDPGFSGHGQALVAGHGSRPPDQRTSLARILQACRCLVEQRGHRGARRST